MLWWRGPRGEWPQADGHGSLLHMRAARCGYGRGRGNVLHEELVGVGRCGRWGRGWYRHGNSPRDDGDLDVATLAVKSPVRRGAIWHGQHRHRAPLRRDPQKVCSQSAELGACVRGVHALHRLSRDVSRERRVVEVLQVLSLAVPLLGRWMLGRMGRMGRRRSSWRRRNRRDAFLAALAIPWLVESRVMAFDTDDAPPRVDRVRWQLYGGATHAASGEHQRCPGGLRLVEPPH